MSTLLTRHPHTDDDVIEALRGLGFAIEEPHSSSTTVLDTFDGRLAAAGCRLELRDGPTRELVLHGPGDSPAAHVAWTRAAPGPSTTLPSGPFGARIAEIIVERALLPVATISSTAQRATRNDRRGKPTIAATTHLDIVIEPAPLRPSPTLAVELVVTLGHEAEHDRAAMPLVALGLEVAAGPFVEAVVESSGGSLAGHVSSPTVPLRRGDDALDSFRAVLRNLLTTIDDNLPGTLADLDTEFLHDLRVAVRRTRVVLAEGKRVLPPQIRDRYRAEFAQLAAATSRTRDLDVYLLDWDTIVAPLGLDDLSIVEPVRAEIEARRHDAYSTMVQVLRSKPTTDLLDRWRSWLDDPDQGRAAAGDAEHLAIGPHVADRIARAQDGVLRDGRAITPGSPAERLHDLRKDAKKLRYLFECFGSVLPDSGRKAFVGQLKALQDNLGLHQDAEVQVAELNGIAHTLRDRPGVHTDTLLVVGRIIDHLERVRQRERDAFADRFHAYDSRANRRLLATLLAKAAST